MKLDRVERNPLLFLQMTISLHLHQICPITRLLANSTKLAVWILTIIWRMHKVLPIAGPYPRPIRFLIVFDQIQLRAQRPTTTKASRPRPLLDSLPTWQSSRHLQRGAPTEGSTSIQRNRGFRFALCNIRTACRAMPQCIFLIIEVLLFLACKPSGSTSIRLQCKQAICHLHLACALLLLWTSRTLPCRWDSHPEHAFQGRCVKFDNYYRCGVSKAGRWKRQI